jgi:5'-nucleotidase
MERSTDDWTRSDIVKRILYIDMDGVLVDCKSAFECISADEEREYKDPDHIPGIFGRMDPKPGAIEAYRELSQLFDTYVLSTAPRENPSAWSDKLLWVKQYLNDVAYKRLILTHHKELLSGDFLIDDRTENGADRFVGELLLFGTPRFPDWSSVMDYLRVASQG